MAHGAFVVGNPYTLLQGGPLAREQTVVTAH